MLTKGAIGNLINRYKAVLKKCHLMNTFGSLAVASMLVLGGAGMAKATEYTTPITGSSSDTAYISNGILSVVGDTAVYTFKPGDILNISGMQHAIESLSGYSKDIEINDIDIVNNGSSNPNSYAIFLANSDHSVSVGEGDITNISERSDDATVSNCITITFQRCTITKGDGNLVATNILYTDGDDSTAYAHGIDAEAGSTVYIGAGDIIVNTETIGNYDSSAMGRGFFLTGSGGIGVKGDGNIFVTVQAASGISNADGIGIDVQESADFTLGKENIDIQVKNESVDGKSTAVGIRVLKSGTIAAEDGTIKVNANGGELDVTAVQVSAADGSTSTANLGVMDIIAGGTTGNTGSNNAVRGLTATGNQTGINLEGGTLTIATETGNATGISAVRSTIHAGTTADLAVSVASSNAVAIHSQGNSGNVSLGNENGHVTITATGEGATGIQLADEGTVTLKGNTVINAEACALSLLKDSSYVNGCLAG